VLIAIISLDFKIVVSKIAVVNLRGLLDDLVECKHKYGSYKPDSVCPYKHV